MTSKRKAARTTPSAKAKTVAKGATYNPYKPIAEDAFLKAAARIVANDTIGKPSAKRKAADSDGWTRAALAAREAAIANGSHARAAEAIATNHDTTGEPSCDADGVPLIPAAPPLPLPKLSQADRERAEAGERAYQLFATHVRDKSTKAPGSALEVAKLVALDDEQLAAASPEALRVAYRDLRDRALRALQTRQGSGKKGGGYVPYGSEADGDGVLRACKAEQLVIAEAKLLRSEKETLRDIADRLYELGMRPRVMPDHEPRERFSANQIRRMTLPPPPRRHHGR